MKNIRFSTFKRWFLIIAILMLGLGSRLTISQARASYEIDFPDPQGYVNDFANVISNDDVLEQKLATFDKEESVEIFVIIVDELPENTTLDQFIPELTDSNSKWKAGKEENDNGVILTIVMNDRDMRIDVGYGLEGAIPDITAKHILDDDIKPYFKEEKYNEGVEAGVDSIIAAAKGEYEGVSSFEQVTGIEDLTCLNVLFFVTLFFIPYTASFLARTKSWWLGGLLGFILSIVYSFSLLPIEGLGVLRYASFVILPMIFTPIGLLFDYILSKNYQKLSQLNRPTSWFRTWGGFSTRSSFGSSSRSVFGGGGGSFGGGGARSSW
ncbi:TPM domain-containing protein [Candidatus Dojkabacteria bacterium]|nr:TPM domain-containing protein [Candidatus Dojkabacteria bacterium]